MQLKHSTCFRVYKLPSASMLGLGRESPRPWKCSSDWQKTSKGHDVPDIPSWAQKYRRLSPSLPLSESFLVGDAIIGEEEASDTGVMQGFDQSLLADLL